MAELFRYIEQSFVIPSPTRPVDVERESDQQDRLRGAISEGLPPDRLREIAGDFILEHFSSPVSDPFHLGKQYLSFGSKLLNLPSPDERAIQQLVSKVFVRDAHTLVGSKAFVEDKALLDDALVSVKIATAFDRVNAHSLVAMRQAIAFLDDFATGKVTNVTAEGIRTTLRRPILIPSAFLKSLTVNPDPTQPSPVPDPAADPAAQKRMELTAQQNHLETAYEMIMSLPPDQFELKPLRSEASRSLATGHDSAREVSVSVADMGNANPTFLALSQGAIERLGDDVRQTLERAYIDLSGSPVADVITAIKKQWQDVSGQLAPYQVPAPARVFRVGVHLFAIRDPDSAPASGAATTVSDTAKEEL